MTGLYDKGSKTRVHYPKLLIIVYTISEFKVPLDLLIFVLHSIRSEFTRTKISFSATYFDRKTAIRFI